MQTPLMVSSVCVDRGSPQDESLDLIVDLLSFTRTRMPLNLSGNLSIVTHLQVSCVSTPFFELRRVMSVRDTVSSVLHFPIAFLVLLNSVFRSLLLAGLVS